MHTLDHLEELVIVQRRSTIIFVLLIIFLTLIVVKNRYEWVSIEAEVDFQSFIEPFNFRLIEKTEIKSNSRISRVNLKLLRDSLPPNTQPGCLPRLDDDGPVWPTFKGHYMSSEEYYHYLLDSEASDMRRKLREISTNIDPILFETFNATSVNDLDKFNVVEYAQEAYWAAVHLHCRMHREDELHNFDWRSIRAKHSLPFIGGHNLRFIADHLFENGNRYIDVTKVKPGDVVYVMMNELPLFLTLFHPNITSPYVILSHSEDDSAPTSKFTHVLNDKSLLAWFTINYDLGYEEQVPKVPEVEGQVQNLPMRHSKLYPIVLGVQNQVFVERKHPLAFELLRFLTWYQVPREKRPYLLSLQLLHRTNPKFLNFSNDTLVVTKRQSHIDYYLTMSQSQFVLSPPGHGQDCHRIIEAILMGAIPIVLKTMPMDTLFDRSVFGDYDEEGFSASWPVLRVNKYDEVTPEFLRQWKPASENYIGRKPAFLRYWVEKIRHVAASRLDEYVLSSQRAS